MRNSRRSKSHWKSRVLPALLAIVLVVAAAGFFYAHSIWRKYDGLAAEYDLSELREMESASMIYDRNGKLLGRIYVHNRDTIALKDLPYHLVQAVIAAEDNRFFKHEGADYIGMVRAAIKNWRAGRIVQGASTLTQQLARNTYELREQSYERKLVEVFLAKRIENKLSKKEILELYLNRVYYGAGLYGAEAAASGYFGKSARELTVAESAMLAGLLKSPNNLSPWSDRAAAEAEKEFVLGRMHELEMLDDNAYREALAQVIEVKNRKNLNAQSYAIDFIRQQVINNIGFENAVSEGYRIFTTIDADLQKTAEDSLRQTLGRIEGREGYAHPTYAEYDAMLQRFWHNHRGRTDDEGNPPTPPAPEYLQGAVLALDNRDGGILAMVGGRDFEHSEYNRATLARRPSGTAFLPFVYAAAYEKGYSPGYPVEDSPLDNRQVMIGGTTGVLGEWGPERLLNRYEGTIPARRALIQSKNAASVRLGLKTGLEEVKKLAESAGIESPLRPFPATFLGSSEVGMYELVRAYTAFPLAGSYPKQPFVIRKIVRKSGEEVYRESTGFQQALTPETAYQIHDSLSESLETGTADKATVQYGLKRFEAGGKTGTAYNFTDLWFVGYSSSVTCGVWVGFDKPKTIYRGAFSSDIALPVWVDIMNASLSDFPAGDIPRPESLERHEMERETGKLASQLPARSGRNLADAWLSPKQYKLLAENKLGLLESMDNPGQWPKAQGVVDTEKLEPVPARMPTVVGGVDPYSAITRTVMKAEAVNPGDRSDVQVMRAEAVRPFDQPLDSPAITLDPPEPLEF